MRRLGPLPGVFAEWIDVGSLADTVRDGRLYGPDPRRTLPKSVAFAVPSGVSITLAGLTSWWTSPLRCACSRPHANWTATSMTLWFGPGARTVLVSDLRGVVTLWELDGERSHSCRARRPPR